MSQPPANATTSPKPSNPEWPYLLPMGVFMAFIFLGGLDKWLYPWAYIGRTIVVAVLLVWVWPRVKRDIKWTHLPLGVVVGVVGTFQWIGMELGLMKLFGTGGLHLSMLQFVSNIENSYDYPGAFESKAMLYTFLAIRLLGPVLVVPIMEELFWRDWLWRTIASDGDYESAPIGGYEKKAVWLLPLAFALVHVQFLTAIVWALLIAWLLLRTKSLGACIVAHATTNLLLGLWVLATWKWIPLEKVPFHTPHWFFW
jgi:CAAX prenyl protease-like protein